MAIVGAGPTGITAATLLAQHGVRCLVLDRWDDVYPQPRAVHLDDEIYRVLARLGIADSFAGISRPALGLRLLDGTMTVLAEFSRDTSLSSNGFPQANMFDQPELERLLRANLQHYPRVELQGGVEVGDIVDHGSFARVTYTQRADGTRHTVTADYVLGCDGANSLVRNKIGSTMEDVGGPGRAVFAQRWLVVDVATTAELHQWDGVHQVCDPLRAATYMRIGPDRYRWEFQLLDGESAAHFGALDTLGPLIRPWVRDTPTDTLEVLRVTEYTFRAQLADRWRRGRVFLLGDAAHLTPPFIGQGMGAGVRDSMNLTWKLAGVLHGSLPEDVLDSYQVERKPHTRHMIRVALGVGRAMTAGGEIGNVIRRVVIPRLYRVPGFADKLLDGRTPPLRRSSVVFRSRVPGRLGGSLCPNPVGTQGYRLDSTLGTSFAVITTAQPTAAERTLVDNRGAALLTVARDSDLGRWLRTGRATTAVIRPDRTVMCAGRHLGKMCDVLPQFSSPTTTSVNSSMRSSP